MPAGVAVAVLHKKLRLATESPALLHKHKLPALGPSAFAASSLRFDEELGVMVKKHDLDADDADEEFVGKAKFDVRKKKLLLK